MYKTIISTLVVFGASVDGLCAAARSSAAMVLDESQRQEDEDGGRDQRPPSAFLGLPPAQQTWAHGVSSRAQLREALDDAEITAIEADILMGRVLVADAASSSSSASAEGPIMAHPPSRESDLSFEEFLEACVADGKRHIKLDFKELEAAKRCLPLVAEVAPRLQAAGRTVFLNADILNGPGRRCGTCAVPAAEFLELVRLHCPGAPLSIGWRVVQGALDSYTEADCTEMSRVYEDYALSLPCAPAGVVFPVALRLAVRSAESLSGLLRRTPSSQLLVWTGTGERPPPRSVLEAAKSAFDAAGVGDRVGYDCRVAASPFEGFKSDVVMGVGGIFGPLANRFGF